MDTGEDAARYIAQREAAEGSKIEGITYNENLILLDPEASTSGVYEELIHSAQHRTGKFSETMEKYGYKATELLMEKEAAEKLLKNARPWKIPEDEIIQIRERLSIFINDLKTLGL